MQRLTQHPPMLLPTAEDIARWKGECERIDETIQKLSGQREAYQNLIKGAETLIGGFGESSPPPDKPIAEKPAEPEPRKLGRKPGGAQTWTATIDRIIAKFPQGITHERLREEVGKTHLARKLKQTDKSFYGAIGKLVERQLAAKHNGHLFKPEALATFLADVEAGKLVDVKAPRVHGESPFGDAITAFMRTRPMGASSAEIAGHLRDNPSFADTMDRHKSHLYNVLGRLVDQGTLVKGGGKYFLAPGKGE